MVKVSDEVIFSPLLLRVNGAAGQTSVRRDDGKIGERQRKCQCHIQRQSTIYGKTLLDFRRIQEL